MRITEILTESQLEQLDEGPILNKIGSAVGNVAGGVAKGVGAVAGGIAGLGSAFKKGFDRSKGIVGQGGDYVAPPDAPPAPAAAAPAAAPAAPAAAPEAPGAAAAAAAAPAAASGDAGMSTTTPPSAAEINAQGPKGTAPAKAQTGDAGKALAKSTAVVDKQQAASQTKANQTVYAQIKANVDKLDKKGKQQILQLLQKSMSAPAPAAAPAKPGAAPAGPAGAPAALDPRDTNKDGTVDATEKSIARNKAKPGAAPAATTAAPDPGAAAFGNMAGQLAKGGATEPTAATPAATPAADSASAPGSKLTPQQAAAQQALKDKLKAGGGATSGQSKFKQYTKDASSQRVVGANKDGSPKIQQIKASKDNYGNALSEALARRVEFQKQKMFETGLAQGTISVFRK